MSEELLKSSVIGETAVFTLIEKTLEIDCGGTRVTGRFPARSDLEHVAVGTCLGEMDHGDPNGD